MLRSATILMDDREKVPLIFPEHLVIADGTKPATVHLTVRRQRLPYGDYTLDGYGARTLIERKGSLAEVANNIFVPDRRARFIHCLESMKAVARFPVLLFEGTPHTLLLQQPNRHAPFLPSDPHVVLSALLGLLLTHSITPIFLPAATSEHRRAMGKFAAWYLLQGALADAVSTVPRD